MRILTAIIIFMALMVRTDIVAVLWIASFGLNMYLLSKVVADMKKTIRTKGE